MELVVFVASLKFFFVEGGEQFIFGIQIAKKIGLKQTIQITIAGISFATILFFLLFYSHSLISTRWLELALAITLYFFAASMFKEVLEKEHEEKEFDEKVHKYGYITIVSLESVENATVLAALTFIDISGALVGTAISIAIIIIIAGVLNIFSHTLFNMRFTWKQLKFMFQEIRRVLRGNGFNFY